MIKSIVVIALVLIANTAGAQAVVLPISRDALVLKRDDLVRSVQPAENGTAVGLAPAGVL